MALPAAYGLPVSLPLPQARERARVLVRVQALLRLELRPLPHQAGASSTSSTLPPLRALR
eukprot:3526557-Prymnesium_polylepis.1